MTEQVIYSINVNDWPVVHVNAIYISLAQAPQNALHSSSLQHNCGERERAPTLLMSMEIVSVRAYVRPRPTARLRMRERC